MTYIIGLNSFHADSSACLLRDGQVVAAAEEERFRRVKHWAGFPSEALNFCLAEANIQLSDVKHIAINQDRSANFWRKLFFLLSTRPDYKFILERWKNKSKRVDIASLLATATGSNFHGEIHNIEHHLSHLASAFYPSSFNEATIVSIDGFGDFSSTAWAMGKGTNINIQGRINFPHSLGIFYQALTQWLGFDQYGDEYKVMGLAPYGSPKFLPEMRQIVKILSDGSFELNLSYFLHDKSKVDYVWDGGSPKISSLYSSELIGLLGPVRKKEESLTQRHMDIARSIQAMYEEAFFALLNKLHQLNGCDYLALAGGCAMNSVANGKIHLNTPFKEIYVQAAAGDAGGALGAAYSVWHELGGTRGPKHDHAYFGPHFSNDQICKVLVANQSRIDGQNCDVHLIDDEHRLCSETAASIAKGEVVGWFQGSMEWGPRALGNRSIIGDPRRADMKDILNLKIKRRESFRPFAPSILKSEVKEWFEQDGDVPFMMQVYQIKPHKRYLIPAVTHVDGSGRLQTVSSDSNSRYHNLITEFYNLTNIPMVLNTSFNENEPVVCTPEEALNCFLRTKMDLLVMGDWVIRRRDPGHLL